MATNTNLGDAASSIGGTDMANETADGNNLADVKPKLHGRAFYESIGSPKYIVAPMVDQSEFAWRMLSRQFLPPSQRSSVLAYSPMLHARLFAESEKYREAHFQPQRRSSTTTTAANAGTDERQSKGNRTGACDSLTWKAPGGETPAYLDGNPAIDRPLFVQFCANDPTSLLAAAKLVAPFCDAVDLNLGCPQGIARKGHYGAFLQEDQELIYNLIHTLHSNLSIPVTAKIRILETKEATLKYARNVLKAGASILTVHGRRREQKGHLTGKADWGYIKYLREQLPKETVIFANGNILQHKDFDECLEETGVDGVMTAEGNLSNPGLFADVPPGGEDGPIAGLGYDSDHQVGERDYWIGRDGKGGWRVDAVMRRYLDILHEYVLDEKPPTRRELFLPGDDEAWLEEGDVITTAEAEDDGPARKKRRKDKAAIRQAAKEAAREGGAAKNARGGTKDLAGPNLGAVQAHLFHLLRHLVSEHHDIRDMLARSGAANIDTYEQLLELVERRIARGLLHYEKTGVVQERGNNKHRAVSGGHVDVVAETTAETNGNNSNGSDAAVAQITSEAAENENDPESSIKTIKECKRPWWIAQPIIRPLPKEALAKGAISVSKKDKRKLETEQEQVMQSEGVDGQGQGHGGVGGQPTFSAKPSLDESGSLDKVTSFQETSLVSG